VTWTPAPATINLANFCRSLANPLQRKELSRENVARSCFDVIVVNNTK
jgi:hypothetical protein